MKNYAVVHMQKFKSYDLKGIQFHNQRERESKTNPDINKEKSHLNYDLHNQENINYNKKVDEIIKKNVITNRKIRKDAVRMCNFIVTSDKSFFENLSQEEQDQFFKKSYEFFKDRYGEDKIVSAMIHLDEATPHMHLSLVPVIENKLSAKRLFNRKELLAIQEEYPKYIQKEGFKLKRGQEGSDKKHLTTQEFKEEKIKELDIDIEKKNKMINNFNKNFPELRKKVEKEINEHFDNAINGFKGVLKVLGDIDKDNNKDLPTTPLNPLEGEALKERMMELAKGQGLEFKEDNGNQQKQIELHLLIEIFNESYRNIKKDIDNSLNTEKTLKNKIGSLKLEIDNIKSIKGLVTQLEDYQKVVEENNPAYLHGLLKNRSNVNSENEDYKNYIQEKGLEKDFDDYLEEVNQEILEMNLEQQLDLER